MAAPRLRGLLLRRIPHGRRLCRRHPARHGTAAGQLHVRPAPTWPSPPPHPSRPPALPQDRIPPTSTSASVLTAPWPARASTACFFAGPNPAAGQRQCSPRHGRPPSLARAARPPPVHHGALPVLGRLFRPTGGRRYDVFWALGRRPGAVPLLLPQVVEEQYCQAGRTPFLCSKPPGAVGMQAIRPLSTGAIALLHPLATGVVALLHCRHRLRGTRFYPRLPQVNRAAFSSLLLTKLLDVEVVDD
ncbi:uncharacterized protein LOC119365806 isoform X2 [Triticum dicoccoides]|uniref:uncharacterized protein LOC119365806 isoform X2 n=1 Tax=Triticum dicoccoides TaxID=85692 RepID=UPI00189029FA|nr:uncharacterized protein LOC119365806 isoform X2 [Triticum dicoccoides]